MKCIGGALLLDNEAKTYRSKRSWSNFASLNELRLQLLKEPGMAQLDWEDFGRGATPVRQIMLGAALTALDAPETDWNNCSCIGWNGDGCKRENVRYFADYLDSGRSGGRGSLFVPTLPSIPVCEAAIMLGCHGGGAYFTTGKSTGQLGALLPLNGEKYFLTGEITARWCAVMLWDTGIAGTIPEAENLCELFQRSAR